ncbi:MAG: threonine synthase [Oscillospiraceae bacterium]|nr:threonine synthase [Oscillospiraceae bacterium]
MNFHSTRDKSKTLSAAQAIAKGLSEDGGLFVPDSFPKLSQDDFKVLLTMDYKARAVDIMGRYLADFTAEELTGFAANAYGKQFDTECAAPVRTVNDGTHYLELWHGPTSAFKDMALQMLPYLLTTSIKKTGETKKVCILTATSGDTGKAALEGFCDVPDCKIMVFYPKDGVSQIQELQMTSQEGSNVSVASVYGNFDDAQTGVKKIFSDPDFRAELADKGWFLSSANSINFGRLLPQVVYYISAYCDLVNAGSIAFGDAINFCVPTGNFGNILAGYYAKQMGLPVHKLICASNANDVLTEFIETGVYNRKRPFFTTVSPSMDILVSSNLERLLYHLTGGDDAYVRSCMEALERDGCYKVSDELLKVLHETFACGCCDEDATKAKIADMFGENHYLIDTHTAVAGHVLDVYRKATGDERTAVVVSTASPYKFCGAVLAAIGGTVDCDGIALLDRLNEKSGAPVPKPLASLKGKNPRFNQTFEKEAMTQVVRDFI